jgi:predicted O-methyltransferase YrrM
VPVTGNFDDAAVGDLIERLARARGARKALAVGSPDHHDWLVSLARGLPADGVLIVFYPDAAGMRAVRESFDRAHVANRANVMLGNPALLVRKVAGPFDVVLNCDGHDEDAWRARLIPLVAPRGLLISASPDGVAIIAT